jgi:tetratricopeptide repeat protein 30
MKSMEPYHRKLGPDTWFYAKRCFLGLALTLAKHMTTIRDSTMDDILEFLDGVDQHGKDILTTTTPGALADPSTADNDAPRTVSYEVHALLSLASTSNRLTIAHGGGRTARQARVLKRTFLKLRS